MYHLRCGYWMWNSVATRFCFAIVCGSSGHLPERSKWIMKLRAVCKTSSTCISWLDTLMRYMPWQNRKLSALKGAKRWWESLTVTSMWSFVYASIFLLNKHCIYPIYFIYQHVLFLQKYNLKVDPKPFYKFLKEGGLRDTMTIVYQQRLKFVQWLARDLDNRYLNTVYKRFKRIYSKSVGQRQGR